MIRKVHPEVMGEERTGGGFQFFHFFQKPAGRLALLGALALGAVVDFAQMGVARKTFVFYDREDRKPVVEDRMLKRSDSKEEDITRYVEEALLGPISLECGPLFPRETRLLALLYREGTVYVDLAAPAALPPGEGGNAFDGFLTLNRGIRRNFPYVRDVRLFAAGNEVYYGQFRRLFGGEGMGEKN